MSYQANVLNVMVASPRDVSEERRIVAEEVQRWNDAHAFARKIVLMPIRWETNSTPQLREGGTAQGVLNVQLLGDADILIGIFGVRIGTKTLDHPSGSVEEIKRHIGAGKTAKVYFSGALVDPSSIDHQQYAAVQTFKGECKSLGLYAAYTDLQQFQRDFKQHLDIELNQARYLWMQEPTEQVSSVTPKRMLSELALKLLVAAEANKGNLLNKSIMGGGLLFVAGTADLKTTTPREQAAMIAAVSELETGGYLRVESEHMRRITDLGYRYLDAEKEAAPTTVNLRVAGDIQKQLLLVEASKDIEVQQLDYLDGSDACLASQLVGEFGQAIQVQVLHEHVVKITNAGAFKGKLRLLVKVASGTEQLSLPISLRMSMGPNSTLYQRVEGSQLFTLS